MLGERRRCSMTGRHYLDSRRLCSSNKRHCQLDGRRLFRDERNGVVAAVAVVADEQRKFHESPGWSCIVNVPAVTAAGVNHERSLGFGAWFPGESTASFLGSGAKELPRTSCTTLGLSPSYLATARIAQIRLCPRSRTT